MAVIKNPKGSQLLVLVGDGEDPEVFAHPCTINAEREFSLDVNYSEDTAIDCDDPEAPGWLERTADSLSGTITGSGKLNAPDYLEWFNWAESGLPRNCKVKINVLAAAGGVTVTGQFVVSNLSMSGARGGKMEGSITLQSHGALAAAANA